MLNAAMDTNDTHNIAQTIIASDDVYWMRRVAAMEWFRVLALLLHRRRSRRYKLTRTPWQLLQAHHLFANIKQ